MNKTKHNTFKDLTKDFYYVDSDITEKNFPWPKTVSTENYKIINMGKSYSSQEALVRMQTEGCRPATIHELIVVSHENPELFPDGKWSSLVAFDTDFIDSDGRHRVPYVDRSSDGDRGFSLGVFEDDWGGVDCLLAFFDKNTIELYSGEKVIVDVVSLILRIEKIEAWIQGVKDQLL